MRKFIIIIALLVFSVCLCSMTVFAQENTFDYLADNAIVNFNQFYKNPTFSSDNYISSYGAIYNVSDNSVIIDNSSYNSGIYLTNTNYDSNHKYYVIISLSSVVDTNIYVAFRSSRDNMLSISTDKNKYVLYIDSGINAPSYGGVTYITSDSVDFTLYNFSVIDLTQMFGVNNEPTLEQCQSIFTADYYNYNAGTALSLNGVNSYQQGVDDTLNSYNVVTSPLLTANSAFPVFVGSADSLVVSSDIGYGPAIGCINYVGLPLFAFVESNVTLTINIDNIYISDKDINVSLGYIQSGNYISIYTFDINSFTPVAGNAVDFDNFKLSFTLPVSTDYLVLYTGSSENVVTLTNVNFTYRLFNNAILVDNAYNSGYDNGKNYGYNQGYKEGILKGSSGDISFVGLLNSVITAPVTMFFGELDNESGERLGGLFNFDILGYNMSTFLTSLLTVVVVVSVIRFFV